MRQPSAMSRPPLAARGFSGEMRRRPPPSRHLARFLVLGYRGSPRPRWPRAGLRLAECGENKMRVLRRHGKPALVGAALLSLTAAALAQTAASPAPAAAAEAVKFDTGDTAWMLTSTALVLMMTIPGLALFYGGMVRK